jgi:uncharacterized membrane protein
VADLTLVVSLEAIFLSTFVMIGQNRQSEFQHAKADHDFVEEELELKTNTDLTRAIHTLTTDIHRKLMAEADPVVARRATVGTRSSEEPHTGPMSAAEEPGATV